MNETTKMVLRMLDGIDEEQMTPTELSIAKSAVKDGLAHWDTLRSGVREFCSNS